jgi:hypothetical protein
MQTAAAYRRLGGQGKPELIAGLGGVEDARAVLVPELVAGGGEPRGGGAVEDVDRPGIGDSPDLLEENPRRQVLVAVAVEVARGRGIIICFARFMRNR